MTSATREFGWMSALADAERGSVGFSDPGVMLDDGDWYIDATSPRRGPVLAMEGEKVPVGGVYIRKSQLTDEVWQRLQLAASGKL